MTPRATSRTPSHRTELRRMRPMVRTALPLVALVGLAACADAPTAASSAPPAPSLGRVAGTPSGIVSQVTVGDTVITVFTVGTNTSTAATINLGHSSKIDFPYAAGSICDLVLSSYGPGTWDAPCQPATTPTQITAKVWVNAQGKLASDFQPAMRFVPALKRPVTLFLKDASMGARRIDFCSPSGCVNEALTDPSVATQFDAANGWAYRVIKHFSGYTVTAD